jgi:hypothetical protein
MDVSVHVLGIVVLLISVVVIVILAESIMHVKKKSKPTDYKLKLQPDSKKPEYVIPPKLTPPADLSQSDQIKLNDLRFKNLQAYINEISDYTGLRCEVNEGIFIIVSSAGIVPTAVTPGPLGMQLSTRFPSNRRFSMLIRFQNELVVPTDVEMFISNLRYYLNMSSQENTEETDTYMNTVLGFNITGGICNLGGLPESILNEYRNHEDTLPIAPIPEKLSNGIPYIIQDGKARLDTNEQEEK